MSLPFRPDSHRRLPLATIGMAFLALIVLSLTLISSDTALAAGAFNPHGTLDLSAPAAGANANIVSSFCIDYNTDCTLQAAPIDEYNFGLVVSFTPKDFNIVKGSDIPDGAGVGYLASSATLGLVNGPCASGLRPEFKMMDATTDISDVLANAYGATGGRNVGAANDQYDDGIPDSGTDSGDSGGVPVNGQPLGVTKYPDYLTRIFKDASDATITPRARLYGQALVAGAWVSLNFVLFEPGVSIKNPVNGTVFSADPALGYPSVTVLQALGDPDSLSSPSPITDFCSPLDSDNTTCGFTQVVSAMTGANPCPASSGTPYRANPGSDMTVNFVTLAASQRDADGDGFENGLDTCPFTTNVENPHDGSTSSPTYAQGPDFDAIDSSCDPEPANTCWANSDPIGQDAHSATDCDGDEYSNAGDNCPQIANGKNADEAAPGAGNQKDTDGDGIGDPCDTNPTSPDGEPIIRCVVTPVNIGGGGTPIGQPDQYLCTTTGAGLDLNRDGVLDFTVAGGAGTTTTTTTTTTTGGTTTTTGGADGGPATGIGSLAPAASSIPLWGALASAFGGAGLLGSLGAFARRVLRRKR